MPRESRQLRAVRHTERRRVGRDDLDARGPETMDHRIEHRPERVLRERSEYLHDHARGRRQAAEPAPPRARRRRRRRRQRRRVRRRIHRRLDRTPREVQMSRDERGEHPPDRPAVGAGACVAPQRDRRRARPARDALHEVVRVQRAVPAPSASSGPVAVRVEHPRAVGRKVRHVLGDQRAASLRRSGRVRADEAAFGFRRREPWWLWRSFRLVHTSDVPRLLHFFQLLGNTPSRDPVVGRSERPIRSYVTSPGRVPGSSRDLRGWAHMPRLSTRARRAPTPSSVAARLRQLARRSRSPPDPSPPAQPVRWTHGPPSRWPLVARPPLASASRSCREVDGAT